MEVGAEVAGKNDDDDWGESNCHLLEQLDELIPKDML